MTTAARPTWAPAKGGNEQGGTRIFGPSQKYSSRDLAAHTSLKPRYAYTPPHPPILDPSMESNLPPPTGIACLLLGDLAGRDFFFLFLP